MKKLLSIATVITLTFGFSSCQNTGPNTQRGAAAGALGGAAIGGIIGHQSGRTTEGAILGAAAGGLGGAAYGNQQDKNNGY